MALNTMFEEWINIYMGSKTNLSGVSLAMQGIHLRLERNLLTITVRTMKSILKAIECENQKISSF